MAYSQSQFDAEVARVVNSIKLGSVMSYGAVARAAGFPRHARMVSKAMVRWPEQLPWYRVVRSDFTLAFALGSDAYAKQEALLRIEGVLLVNNRVVPVESDADVSLDELLWAGLSD